jgi:hypothetical protein
MDDSDATIAMLRHENALLSEENKFAVDRFHLIETLMGNIQHHLDWKNKDEEVVRQVTLDQVKEKFGTLRFYYSGGNDTIDGMVQMAESFSGHICEGCGNLGSTQGNGWVRTECESCRNVRQKGEEQ